MGIAPVLSALILLFRDHDANGVRGVNPRAPPLSPSNLINLYIRSPDFTDMFGPEVERKWQRAWREARIFEAGPDPNRKKFYITVPYPYASGSLHIGHGRTYTIGDVMARYKRMRGYNVLFPMAFHVTGTPVLAIADSIRKGEEKVVKLYEDYLRIYEDDEERVKELISSFVEPENIARYFAEKIQRDFEEMGYSIDWRRKFHTAEPIYNKFVEWQFKKLKDLGLIRKGSYPITYSPADGNAVGEDDIEDGDTDKVSVMEFTAIKFRLGDEYLVAATLRPETIFGVTNVWVNPKATYVRVRVGDEVWIISREAAEKLRYQKEDVEVLGELAGSDLLGAEVEEPVEGRKVPVLPGEFVDPDNATGVVYSVPAHAPFDHAALLDMAREEFASRYGMRPVEIEPIKIIDIEGWGDNPAGEICERMGITSQEDAEKLEEATKEIYREEFYKGVLNERCGKFAGLRIRDIKDEVKDWLRDMGKADTFYETSRKAVTRSGNRVIVAVLRDQWFIDYTHPWWKERGHRAVDRMLFIPEKYRDVMHGIIDWLAMRPCARRRGLGTQLPFEPGWVIESLSDSTIYMALYTVAHIIRRENIPPESLTEEVFDHVFLGKGVPEEISERAGIPAEVIREMRREFLYWYPNDLRNTNPPHLSNHLAFFIMHHTAIFPEEHWPGGISIAGLMIREGAKISKSRGNVIPLAHVSSRYGVDLFRLYCVGSADMESTMDWRESDVNAFRRRLSRMIDLVRHAIDAEPHPVGRMERWFLSRFYSHLRAAVDGYERMRFRDVVLHMIFYLLNDVKRYEERTGKSAVGVMAHVWEDWVRAMAPIIPHTCEELWHMAHDTYVSVEEFPVVREDAIDPLLEREEEFIDSLIEDIRNILNVTGIEPREIYIYTADEWKYLALEIAARTGDFGAAMKEMSREMPERAKEAAKFLKTVFKDRLHAGYVPVDEARVLEEAREYLSRVLGAEIRINPPEDPGGKRKVAMPTRPGVYVL